MQRKRGWVKIVEAFVAILLIAGVVLTLLNRGQDLQDYSKEIYEVEESILFQIQTDEILRNNVVSAGPLPTDAPASIENFIDNNIPPHLICNGRVCDLNDRCGFSGTIDKDVYAKSVAITGTQTTYNPRQLKIFCWLKG